MGAPRLLREAIRTGPPLVLDAAMGTRLIANGLDLRTDDPSLWNLTRPEIVHDIHRRDREAGADVLLTNTFNASRSQLERHGHVQDQSRIHRDAVNLAREAGDGFVVGSIGPGPAGSSVEAAIEQADLLMEAGVDGLVLETHAFPEALSRINVLAPRFVTVWLISLYTWPPEIAECSQQLLEHGADVVGVNCGLGPASSIATTKRFIQVGKAPWLVKPSVAVPGEAMVSGEEFAMLARQFALDGARMIGACCGGTEHHVAAIRRGIDQAKPIMGTANSASGRVRLLRKGCVALPQPEVAGASIVRAGMLGGSIARIVALSSSALAAGFTDCVAS